jgi:hypothetical protein
MYVVECIGLLTVVEAPVAPKLQVLIHFDVVHVVVGVGPMVEGWRNRKD